MYDTQRRVVMNLNHEPPYPDHQTVVFAMRAPHDTAHAPTAQCMIECPHPIALCGEWTRWDGVQAS